MLLAESARVLFGLIAVVGMIGVTAIVMRKAGLASSSGGFVRKRRLAVVEMLALDARRRVAIIKCDDKEHLIVLGATSETLVDKNLETPAELPEESLPAANPFEPLRDLAKKFRPAAKDAA